MHIVVKAESISGPRLHVDKEMLRTWREDFARMMREQGAAANATPKVQRGRQKGDEKDAQLRVRRDKSAVILRAELQDIAKELGQTGKITDPNRLKLLQTRAAVVSQWRRAAEILEAQGEITLAVDVRFFTANLPPVLTRRERLAAEFAGFLKSRGVRPAEATNLGRDTADELAR